MKIAVIGGNGQMGRLIIGEAVTRGHEVTAFVRKSGVILETPSIVVKDLFDLTYDDLKDYEVIVNAFGVWKSDEVGQFTDAAKHLSNVLNGKSNRLLVIGSAGSLYVDEELTKMFMNTPEMPEIAIPVATEQEKALSFLRTKDDVRWTYLSPPVDFRIDGERTGTYQLAGERLAFSSKGESQISYADGAIAVVDEIENGKYINARFSIVAV